MIWNLCNSSNPKIARQADQCDVAIMALESLSTKIDHQSEETRILNEEMKSQSGEIKLMYQEIKSQSKEIESLNQEMESLVAENKEIRDTVLQMNGTLSMILDFCKF